MENNNFKEEVEAKNIEDANKKKLADLESEIGKMEFKIAMLRSRKRINYVCVAIVAAITGLVFGYKMTEAKLANFVRSNAMPISSMFITNGIESGQYISTTLSGTVFLNITMDDSNDTADVIITFWMNERGTPICENFTCDAKNGYLLEENGIFSINYDNRYHWLEFTINDKNYFKGSSIFDRDAALTDGYFRCIYKDVSL